MGATHWGLAMAKYTADGQPPTNRQQLLRYSLSVVPPLVSWVSLGLPPSTAMMVNLFAFAGVFVGDALAVRSGLAPYWWIKLRAPVTFAVILCLGISWVAMNEERF